MARSKLVCQTRLSPFAHRSWSVVTTDIRSTRGEVTGVAVIVDRGASNAVRAAGMIYRSAFSLADLGLRAQNKCRFGPADMQTSRMTAPDTCSSRSRPLGVEPQRPG